MEIALKKMTGIILAGGKNSRMGTNKAFLEIDGIRLINRTVSIFRRIFDEIIIVTNSPLSYLDQKVTLVTDIYKNKGALGGLYAGLFFAAHQHAFVCACDMPFLDSAFIEYMVKKLDNYDIIVPDAGDGLQPLHAIYGKECLPIIKNFFNHDKLKITDLYKGLQTLIIQEDIINTFDPQKRMFININTYEQLQRVTGVDNKIAMGDPLG